MICNRKFIVFVHIAFQKKRRLKLPEGKPSEKKCDGDGKENCVRSSLPVNEARQGDPIALE